MQEESSRIKVLVKRDGKTKEITIDEIVKNDILILAPGNKVPADGILIKGKLSVDESSLNGETKEVYKEYIDNILPDKSKTFVIEASSPYSWYQFVSDESHLFTMNTFGSSGNYKDVLNKYNFDAKYIENKIEELLK